MAEIEGFCNAPFEKLVDVLSGTLDNGGDLGASVAVTVEGEIVADFWGGWADAAEPRRGSATPSSTCGPPPRP